VPSVADFATAMREAAAAGDDTFAAALILARHGFPVFPLDPKTKTPIPPRDKDKNGNPIPGTGGHYKATCDEVQIRGWWKRHPKALIGVPMGARTGIWAADIDTGEDHANGVAAWRELSAAHPAIVTREHRSATGGPHLIFIWDPERPIACGSGALPAGIHVKGMGGYIAVPPSRRKGRAYTVHRDIAPVAPPEWLVEMILGNHERAPTAPDAELVAKDPDMLAFAVKETPNKLKGWDAWKRYAMAIYNALNGDGDRLSEILHEFSEHWELGEYDAAETDKCIREICGCPPRTSGPNAVGAGTVYGMADKLAKRGWRDRYERKQLRDFQDARGAEDQG
jgi:hypothetical protein